MKKTKLVFILSLICFLLNSAAFATVDGKNKKKSKKNQTEVAAPKKKTPAEEEKEKYNKLIKGAKTTKGMFTTHFTPTGELYFELSKDLENRVFLISNRMSATSDAQDFVSGQMIIEPFMVRFKVDTARVVMYRVQVASEVAENDPIKISFDKNITDPILKTFKPVAKNGDNMVIDVTAFFGKDEKAVSPMGAVNPFMAIYTGKAAISGSFVKDDSYIMNVRTFPNNIEIRSLLNYDRGNATGYTVEVNRSVVLLPEVPMERRKQDNRVGYFSSKINQFSSKEDGMKQTEFIHRWRMEPKEEDMDDYFAGKLVEPKKPIVFYVDNSFPEKWRSTVLQGIEDWRMAFEAAGFKNAISARMYPTKEEDPNFDPDDLRYSCIKYATVTTANAMGPSHVDPRSGEILNGDVIWYHNVVQLVHNWRFVQTGAVDPRVRKNVFDDDVMCESLRYVTSHEVGHTLGLMHNMGASYAYPVDSLRSPSFTKMYGTTPSIMDYARNNFVAQPGDLEKGVRLTPPILGVYDVHAINWGYRLFKDHTPEAEKAALNEIIASKGDDEMYRFGAQQMNITDPTDLTEDLGNDHVKAADYCIKNLKIILNHLEEWQGEKGERYEDLQPVYAEIMRQYQRVVMHVVPEVGGIELTEMMQGEPNGSKTIRHFTKAEQKRAMLWVVNQARNLSWTTPKKLVERFPISSVLPSKNNTTAAGFLSPLFSNAVCAHIYESSTFLGNKDAYTVEGYVNDLLAAVFESTLKGKKLTPEEMNIEMTAIDYVIKNTGIKASTTSTATLAEIGDEAYKSIQEMVNTPTIACSYDIRAKATNTQGCCSHSHATTPDNSFFRTGSSGIKTPFALVQPLMLNKLKWIKNLYESKRTASGDRATKDFYNYQIIKIDKILKNN